MQSSASVLVQILEDVRQVEPIKTVPCVLAGHRLDRPFDEGHVIDTVSQSLKARLLKIAGETTLEGSRRDVL